MSPERNAWLAIISRRPRNIALDGLSNGTGRAVVAAGAGREALELEPARGDHRDLVGDQQGDVDACRRRRRRSRRARRAGRSPRPVRIAPGARRRRSRSRRACPSCGLPSPPPAELCWPTSRWRAVGGEHDPGGPELAARRAAGPRARPRPRRRRGGTRQITCVGVVGDVELAALAPGGVVGKRSRAGRSRRCAGVPLRGFSEQHPRRGLVEQDQAAAGVAGRHLDAVIGGEVLALDRPRAQQRAARASTRAPARAPSRRWGSCRCPRRRGGSGRRRRGPESPGSGSSAKTSRVEARARCAARRRRQRAIADQRRGEQRHEQRGRPLLTALSITSAAARSPERTAPSM